MKRVLLKFRTPFIMIALAFTLPVLYSCTDQYADIIKKENNGGGQTVTGWSKIGTIATPRKNASAVLLNETLYFYGGDDASGLLNDLWSVNLSTETAVQLTSNAFLTKGTLFATPTSLYAIAGKGISPGSNSIAVSAAIASKSLYQYDIATNIWTAIGTSGTDGNFISERYAASYCTVVEKTTSAVYYKFNLIGGFDASDLAIDEIYTLTVTVPLTAANSTAPLKPIWTNTAYGAPIARSTSIFNAGTIYTMAGRNDIGYNRSLYKYDYTASTLAPENIPLDMNSRQASAAACDSRYIYLFGGRDDSVSYDELWRYDITLGTWKKLSSEPAARFGHIFVYFNGKVYLFGGATLDGTYFNDMWVYDPSLDPLK